MDTSRQGNMPRYSSVIRNLRDVRRLTQAELASEVGVKANTVARWESAVSEPDFWNYWSLHALAYLWTEWEIAEFFAGRMELSEARSKWDRRHILRNLASIQDKAARGEETAARLLADSEVNRREYLRAKLSRILDLYEDRDFPPELNDPHKYGLTFEQESALHDKYMSKKQVAILQEIREIEMTDLLREGREWEAIARQESDLRRQRAEHEERARDVRKRFEALRKQRQEARGLLNVAIHINTEAPEDELDLFDLRESPVVRIARALGVQIETGEQIKEQGGEDGTTKHDP